MSLPGFDELFRSADEKRPQVPVAAAGGADPTVIEALAIAAERRWVRPVLSGPRDEIDQVAASVGRDISTWTVVSGDENPAVGAVREIREGRARILMKGQISTPDLMKAVLDKTAGLRTGRVIGQVVLMEIPRDDRRFLMTDTGVTTAPTLEQKQDLLRSATSIARGLGCASPRVAVMSATEKPTPALPDTQEAVELARLGGAGEFGDCVVEGPLSFDLAYSTTAASRKKVGGEVTGGADVLLFPDLLSANLTVKGIMYTADCRFGGILCGAACPIVFMSRADDVETRLRSLAYALTACD